MSKIPADVSPREVARVLTQKGFRLTRQGSRHEVFEKGEGREKIVVTVPRHGPLKRGLLHGVLSDAGISVEEFNRLR
jgi:predicted RNA binding protein YcfA (HicA-like mRNA interferase family)